MSVADKVLTQHSVTFTRLERIRDEITELGDVAVSMETDVVNRQQVKKRLRVYSLNKLISCFQSLIIEMVYCAQAERL